MRFNWILTLDRHFEVIIVVFPSLADSSAFVFDFRVGLPMREDLRGRESLNEMNKVLKDQKDLEPYTEGYELGSLNRLIGSDAVSYTRGVEVLYEKMIARLGSLTKLDEASSARVLEQENHNMKLRQRVAGLE